MAHRRNRMNEREGRGQSSFAQRGQSTEERMWEDDSARRFPGRSRDSEHQLSDESSRGAPRQGYYGSGGSYGYGGSFEHGGPRGFVEHHDYDPGRGNQTFYEATGGFGRDTGGYGREGLGWPGRDENRYGGPGSHPPPARGYMSEDSNRHPSARALREDRRRGYSQESGYFQSGGNRVGAQGSSYGSSDEHSDGRGHDGGGSRAPRPGAHARGPYYGRTPQGYTRSDERIREDVCDQLSHGHVDPSEVSVKVEAGVVTLEGFVESRQDKFHIEEITDSVLGVKEVDNRLRLRRHRPESESREAEPTSGSATETSRARASGGENGARS